MSSAAYNERMEALGAEPLRAELARLTHTEPTDWYLTFKARQAMYAAFKAMATQCPERPEVLTQLFTCCTAVDPIIAAGLKPVYGDISEKTLALDTDQLNVGSTTACVVLQHTFGIIDRVADEALAATAHSVGAVVMEDNAHALARVTKGASGEPLADLSVLSFGVEKMLPTHFGGAIWVNPAMQNTVLKEAIIANLESLPDLDKNRDRAAQHYLNQIRTIRLLPGGQALRKRWEQAGKFEPAVAQVELEGGLNGEPALPSAWVVSNAHYALRHAVPVYDRRKENIALFSERIAGVGKLEAPEGAAWLKYPLFCADKAQAQKLLDDLNIAGIYTVDWYRPLLYPGVTKPEAYGATPTDNLPVTQRISDCIVCLPTDLGKGEALQAIDVIKKKLK